jgi:hypothetical protein
VAKSAVPALVDVLAVLEFGARCPRRSNRSATGFVRTVQRPIEEASCLSCRPGKVSVSTSKAVIDKVLGQRAPVYVGTSASVLHGRLGHLLLSPDLKRSKVQSCIAPLRRRRHHRFAVAQRRPFALGLSESKWCQGRCPLLGAALACFGAVA